MHSDRAVTNRAGQNHDEDTKIDFDKRHRSNKYSRNQHNATQNKGPLNQEVICIDEDEDDLQQLDPFENTTSPSNMEIDQGGIDYGFLESTQQPEILDNPTPEALQVPTEPDFMYTDRFSVPH